ncbi:hypothetical protein D3C71_328870 [compost metagenome]
MLATLAAYKNALVAAVILVLVAGLGVQTVRLERSRALVAKVEGQVFSLEARLAAQAALVANLKTEAERRDAESGKALAAAKRALSTAKARANALQKPPAVPETCAGAIDWAADRGAQLGAW